MQGTSNGDGSDALAVTTIVYSKAPCLRRDSTTRTNSRLLLSDCNVDTDNAVAFLVNDRIDRDLRFTRLTVTDDKFPLAAADRNHRIDSFDACLHRFEYGFTSHNARCRRFDRTGLSRVDWSVAINRLTQCVNNAAKQRFAYRYFHDAAGSFNLIAFTDTCVRSHDNDTDIAFFQVKGHAHNAVGEFEQFARHCIFKPVNTSDTVTDLDDRTDINDLNFGFKLFDLLFNQRADFFRSDTQFRSPLSTLLEFSTIVLNVRACRTDFRHNRRSPMRTCTPPSKAGSTICFAIMRLPTIVPNCAATFANSSFDNDFAE